MRFKLDFESKPYIDLLIPASWNQLACNTQIRKLITMFTKIPFDFLVQLAFRNAVLEAGSCHLTKCLIVNQL